MRWTYELKKETMEKKASQLSFRKGKKAEAILNERGEQITMEGSQSKTMSFVPSAIRESVL